MVRALTAAARWSNFARNGYFDLRCHGRGGYGAGVDSGAEAPCVRTSEYGGDVWQVKCASLKA